MLAYVTTTPLRLEASEDRAPLSQTGIKTFLDRGRLFDSDLRELNFWSTARSRNPVNLLLHKAPYMSIFRRCEGLLSPAGAQRSLEIGAGYGWGSALLKHISPATYVVASDVSADALDRAEIFERAVGVKIDEKWAASADNLPFADGAFDLVFCFSAFHHFIIGNRYRSALAEIVRVLRPGGRFVMLYEPASPRVFYTLARARVRLIRKSSGVDEDVILLDQLSLAAKEAGAAVSIYHFPDVMGRHTLGRMIYYSILATLPWLQRLVPSTINAVISKP